MAVSVAHSTTCRERSSWRRRRNVKTSRSEAVAPDIATIFVGPVRPLQLEDLQRIIDCACTQLQLAHVQRARQLAAQQFAPFQALAESDVRAAVVFGVVPPSEEHLPIAARVESALKRHLLLELGQALSMVGSHELAAQTLRQLADVFVDFHGVRARLESALPAVAAEPRARHFEREVFKHWGEALVRATGNSGPNSAAMAVYHLATSRGVYQHHLQRPLDHLDRRLECRPFWDANELPAALALEAHSKEILSELLGLLQSGQQHFTNYESRVVSAGGWSDVQLYAGCRLDQANCKLCPVTARIISSRPEFNTVVHGSHFFSCLTPGTHLEPHCGPSNYRLRCHLGLVIPEGVRIRVGTEIRKWEPGKCLVFDDSFEHEVWHEGNEDRIVLICDMWHPALDVANTVYPALSHKQREAFDHACNGTHLPLQERVYSTGTTVSRNA
ncbi:hypothetical protein AB1Y20_010139 [Prymnesium parvum]|uniref:Aspartyl/asparaginy/proline hydroxylase domain-containing protein n=1 Tax=Prymnesium parvum TaxID=97485 RepID=A0AB34K3M6_PRYPA